MPHTETKELAVMLDTHAPLKLTQDAVAIEVGEEEVTGINTKAGLAAVEATMQA